MSEPLEATIQDALQRLPSELASRIFESVDLSWRGRYICSPLLLGGVCRSWRKVAWNTPSLWTHAIFLINSRRDTHDIGERIELFGEYIGRSGALPLEINVYSDDQLGYGVEDRELVPLIELINQCSARWCKLNLELPTSLWPHIMPRGPPLHLKHLSFSPLLFNFHVHIIRSDLPMCLLQAIPSLRYLNVLHTNLDYDAVRGSWKDMQYLDVEPIQLDVCMDMIRRCPSLRSAGFTVLPTGDIPAPNVLRFNHATLPDVASLSLRSYKNQDINCEMFFDTLTLPNLRSLSLCDSVANPSSILSMIKRSKANLTRLCLEHTSFQVGDICELLSEHKQVTHLKLEHAANTRDLDTVLRQIFEDNSHLQSFCFLGLWHVAEGWRFLQYISTRLPKEKEIRRLERVHVTLVTGYDNTATERCIMDATTLDHVQHLQAEGVQVTASLLGANYGAWYIDAIALSRKAHR